MLITSPQLEEMSGWDILLFIIQSFSTSLWVSNSDRDSIRAEWSFRGEGPQLRVWPLWILTKAISAPDWRYLFCFPHGWKALLAIYFWVEHCQYFHNSPPLLRILFFPLSFNLSSLLFPFYICAFKITDVPTTLLVIILNHWKWKILRWIFVSHRIKL